MSFHIFIHTALIVWLSACYQNFASAKHNFSVIIIDRGLGGTDFWCLKRHSRWSRSQNDLEAFGDRWDVSFLYTSFDSNWNLFDPCHKKHLTLWMYGIIKVCKSVVNLWPFGGRAASHHFHITVFVAGIRKAILFSLVTITESKEVMSYRSVLHD